MRFEAEECSAVRETLSFVYMSQPGVDKLARAAEMDIAAKCCVENLLIHI